MSKLSFVVEDVTFDIPLEKIPKGCLLLELYSISEKFHIDMTIDGSILLDVDAKEFELVYEYLIKGTLSKELYLSVQHLFEYLMLDYNEFGYPQEFFEIRKEEEFMCANFNNPKFVDHGIRSMYYNLLELTEDVYNDIFLNAMINLLTDLRVIISKSPVYVRSYNDFVSYIYDIITYYKIDKVNTKGLVIAGEALITTSYKHSLNNVDLFLVDRDENAIEEILSRYTEDSPQFYRTEDYIGVNLYDTHAYKESTLKISLVKYTSISEVLSGFDIDCCGICYEISTKKFWITPRAMYAIKHRLNFVDFDRLSQVYEYKLLQYADIGFNMFVPFFDPDKIDIYAIRSNTKVPINISNNIEPLIRYQYSMYINRVEYSIKLPETKLFGFLEIEIPCECAYSVPQYLRSSGECLFIYNEVSAMCYIDIYDDYLEIPLDRFQNKLRELGVISKGYYDSDILIDNKYSLGSDYEIKFYTTQNYKLALRLSDKTYHLLEKSIRLPQSISLQSPKSKNTHVKDYRDWFKCILYNL